MKCEFVCLRGKESERVCLCESNSVMREREREREREGCKVFMKARQLLKGDETKVFAWVVVLLNLVSGQDK